MLSLFFNWLGGLALLPTKTNERNYTMTENKSQIKLAENFIHLVQTKHWNNPELQKAYDDLCEIAIVDMKTGDGCFLGTGTISFLDKTIPDKEFYLGMYNAEYWVYEKGGLLTIDLKDYFYYKQSFFCVISDLKDIVEDIKGQYQIVANERVARCFLINPKKEVVEWALQHEEELGITKEEISLAAEYQAIPELKELILGSL